jgi:D-beta-D-heptose 7-phosphate kinase / D-beta-D-heptose 1-phosphate adenosyltransferase
LTILKIKKTVHLGKWLKMDRIESIISKFKEKKILVVGDVMLDTYLKGDVKRVSPEAPVPIVKIDGEYNTLGGAGNVASNLVSLGCKASLFSFAGNDFSGDILKGLLRKKGVESFIDKSNKTIQKIRIFGGNQQLARADRESIRERKFSGEIKRILSEKAAEADMIIVSDYSKGAVNEDLMNLLAGYMGKIIVDPKPKNKELYRGVFLITPNEKETIEMTSVQNVEDAGSKLKEDLKANILVTRGKKGMSLFSNKQIHIPTYAREVFNVTGAGDTAIATLALALASGASMNEAANLANHAAGITVEKQGTYSVSFSELLSRVQKEESKIVNIDKLRGIVKDFKKKSKKVVWTNGCFDLLHIGHTRYLREAKKLGDILVVGINSDSSVRELKGPDRPVQNESERAEVLSSLEFIDHIVIFPELNPERYLRELEPDIFAKGGDYDLEALKKHSEGKIVEGYGGQIITIPVDAEGASTSKIIDTIVSKKNEKSKS